MTRSRSSGPARRARRTFWALVVVAVLASGSLSAALRATAGPLAGTRVALSGLVLLVALALAARVLFAVDRAGRGHQGVGEDERAPHAHE